MTGVQHWAVGLCMAGIGCTVLRMLCPAGATRRVFGVLTAVFFFCCLLSPLQALMSVAGDWFDFSVQTTVPTTLSETVNGQVEAVLEAALLRDAQVHFGQDTAVERVSVVRDMSRTDSIYIERVQVYLAEDTHPVSPKAIAALERAWGITVEVYYTDG